MTPETAQHLEIYKSLPESDRAMMLCRIEADSEKGGEVGAAAEQTLIAISRSEVARRGVEAPTVGQTMAVTAWAAIVIFPVAVAVGGLYILGAIVLGVGNAVLAFMAANSMLIGGAVGVLIFGAMAWAMVSSGGSGGEGATHRKWERKRYFEHESYEETTK